MDGFTKRSTKADTVLATSDTLSKAIQLSTKGGKSRIDGLYAPDGTKVEEVFEKRGGQDQGGAVANKEAQASLAMSKVAKSYHHKQSRMNRRAEHQKKSAEELEDEDAERKAQKIIASATELEQLQYRELFNFFDVDKDRTWGTIEFAQRMTDIGCNTTVETASNLLYFAGVRDVDRITFNDFIQLMPKLKAFRQLLEKDAMRSFAAKDTRGKGWITCKNLRDILIQMSGPEGFDEEQVTTIVKMADKERIDMVTFDNFIRALFGTSPLLVYKPQGAAKSLLNAACFCGKQRKDSDSDEDRNKF